MEKDKLSQSPFPSSSFSHDVNIMSDFPARSRGHRRAQSEIISLPDDLSFDVSDLGFMDPTDEIEEEEDFLSMYLDMDKVSKEGESSQNEESGRVGTQNVGSGGVGSQNVGSGGNALQSTNVRARHQHSQSMDGSSSMKMEQLVGSVSDVGSLAEAKKAMSAANLADLALVDPKRAKRIWANRQSAARSKERKMRYIAELERKVQTLQTEATTLSAQLTMLQRDTTGLTAENSELKVRVQTMEQQVHLQDALNEALRDEVQRLKMATGQMMANGPAMNYGQPSFGANQQFYHSNSNSNNSNSQATQSLLTARQLQQLQIHSHQYQQLPQLDMRMRGTVGPQNQREINADRSSHSIN